LPSHSRTANFQNHKVGNIKDLRNPQKTMNVLNIRLHY
jgi:hypothetical protein